MYLLISPTEPFEIKRLGKTSPKPERYGADILWLTPKGKFGVQRKQFPGDFLASLHDGRLHKELGQMTALDKGMLIVEGYGQWTSEGHLVDQRAFTEAQLYSLISTLTFEHDLVVIRVRDISSTIRAINSFFTWTEKDAHTSLQRRPNPKNMWGTANSKDWAHHLLQSFPGIGAVQATEIYDHFGKIPMRWETDLKGLMEVKGIGKVRAENLLKALQ